MVALASGALGCSSAGKICTLVACVDAFSATLTVDSTMVPAGRHTLTVTIDGATTGCTFQLPPSSNPVNDPCTAGFDFRLSDQPTDGKYTESIVVQSAASSIEIKQTLDGTVIFDQTISPTYQTVQPNGPGCGPTCRQATAAWTIP